MPASIVLSKLAWSAPDGASVFSDLNLVLPAERIGLVGRNGSGKTTLLRMIAGELSPLTGSVQVDGRLGVLRQELSPAAEATVADLFGAREALAVLRRAEQGCAEADELAEADWSLEARVAAALACMELDVGPETPLSDLSGGQRTRAGLAALVAEAPVWLLLDEPTNHLDRSGRNALIGILRSWSGGVLVASHDRELLEVMDAIVELGPTGLRRYGGGWSRYAELKALERDALLHDAKDAERRVTAVERSLQDAAERQARRDSVGRRTAARGGAPRILLGERKSRSEATAGDATRAGERRRAEALAAVEHARASWEVVEPVAVSLAKSGLPAGRRVLEMIDVSFAYAPERPLLSDFALTVTGPERVAVVGPNGAGKSALLQLAAGCLTPTTGEVRLHVEAAYLDQDVSVLGSDGTVRDAFLRLNSGAEENACRAALAQFRFRASTALQPVAALSGGERLRAGLACALGGSRPRPLLLLDEPTNHLDLDSIAAVEAGLVHYDGALMVVSHDLSFLTSLEPTREIHLTRVVLD